MTHTAPSAVGRRILHSILWPSLALCLGVLVVVSLHAQIESVESANPRYIWVSNGRLEGHLTLDATPVGAFSRDSSDLAVVAGEKVVLMDPHAGEIRKVLQPHLNGLVSLDLESVNFLSPHRLFIQGSGRLPAKRKDLERITPLLAFQWNTEQDALDGKVNSIGAGKDIGSPVYFPRIGYLVLFIDDHFELWRPATGEGGSLVIPDLKQRPNIFEFSPNGRWLLLAQIAMDSSRDPAVVQLDGHRFVDSLRGHKGLVRSVRFSSDSRMVVTACDDGMVRLWSAPDWKLLRTLAGHRGAVTWAEFSSDGQWVASVGEDKTVRVWSTADGTLEQTLQESDVPLRTVAFAPNGEVLAASGQDLVLVWQRRRVD
jgi:WD40 repeat protein